MQLRKRRKDGRRGQLVASLGLATAGLFASIGGLADAQTTADEAGQYGVADDVANDLGKIRVDAAVLGYQEGNGRVGVIEPTASVTFNNRYGDVLSLRATSDTITGATPNGAVPWIKPQTFTTPTKITLSTTSTGASGNAIITKVNGIATRTYTAPANSLPVDSGFADQRYAVDLSYTKSLASDWRLTAGGAYSTERDYQSASANLGVAKDFDEKNTTLSLSVNGEFDESEPYFGRPAPFTQMSAAMKNGNAAKTVFGVVAGITQVMNRYWLAELNYTASQAQGYQTDPYRILSVVDPATGEPLDYLYENRPQSRFMQSVYLGNKVSIGPTVTELSGRAYRDSWGISSVTAELSERVPILSSLYLQPYGRYYRQTAANFFHYYLLGGEALPFYASSDSRLGKFDAITYGLHIGYKTGETGELYLRAENYHQYGDGHPGDAPGALKTQSLFSGISAFSVMIGYTFAFR